MIVRIDDEVALAPLQEEHVDACFALAAASRSEIAPWLPWILRTRDRADVAAYVAAANERAAHDAGISFAILADGAFAGAVDVHDINRTHEVAQIGYWLGTPFLGRGIMTRAVRETARIAFRDHGIHRLELLCAVANLRSRGVAERAGFLQEAVLRRRLRGADGWDDCALYVRFADHG